MRLSGTPARMLARGDLGAKAPAAEIIGFQRVMRIRPSTDPRTMRPASVSSETLTTLQFQGLPAMTRTEKNDYDFAWQ